MLNEAKKRLTKRQFKNEIRQQMKSMNQEHWNIILNSLCNEFELYRPLIVKAFSEVVVEKLYEN